jgi:hypothetical protein
MSVDNDETIAARGFDVRRLLVVFVRLLAVFWLVAGLRHWMVVLDLAGGTPFAELPTDRQIVTCVFAVADLVASVGLWLIASWGAVVWLILALAEAVLHGLFPEIYGMNTILLGFHGVTVLVYAVLTWLVERKS